MIAHKQVAHVNLCVQSDSPRPAGVNPQPPHLKDLYTRSTVNLNEEEAQEVHLLLCEFANVFSKGPGDFERTDLVKYKIDTGDAAPIRQSSTQQQEKQRELCKT